MCSVLEFSSESDKLRTLFSESNRFDSVLFIFDGGRRYKVSSSSLGIHSPQDLLLPLGLGLFRSSPFWSYYLYPQGCNFHKGIDGLCGEVIRHTGSCVSEQSCHIFPTAPVAGCISFIGATTNTVWNAVVWIAVLSSWKGGTEEGFSSNFLESPEWAAYC